MARKPNFSKLVAAYPKSRSPCDDRPKWQPLGYGNQCAIRMSIALNGEGTVRVSKKTYTEPRCSHGHARGAESLANFLWRQIGPPNRFRKGDRPAALAKAKLASTSGIIFFKDCFTRDGETRRRGDHIDLWSFGKVVTFDDAFDDPGNVSAEVWFWTLT